MTGSKCDLDLNDKTLFAVCLSALQASVLGGASFSCSPRGAHGRKTLARVFYSPKIHLSIHIRTIIILSIVVKCSADEHCGWCGKTSRGGVRDI